MKTLQVFPGHNQLSKRPERTQVKAGSERRTKPEAKNSTKRSTNESEEREPRAKRAEHSPSDALFAATAVLSRAVR